MSKIIQDILEGVPWLDKLAGGLTIFFILLFIFIVIGVLRIKKKDVEEFKRIPLDSKEPEEE
jgi:hypothetical protein